MLEACPISQRAILIWPCYARRVPSIDSFWGGETDAGNEEWLLERST